MSFAEDYIGGYRVKFVDVRIKPPGGKRARANDEVRARVCEHKGCDSPGEHRAPRQPSSKGAAGGDHWFCQRHAAEHNQSFNFFDGMTEEEAAAFHAASTFGHKPTWRFGSGPMGGLKSSAAFDPGRWRGRSFFDAGADGEPRPAGKRSDRTRLEGKALDELDLPHDATPQAVRDRYSELVKRFHPDSNGGDRTLEHRLAAVIRAFRTLKAAGLA